MQVLRFKPEPNFITKTVLDGVSLQLRIFWNGNSKAWYMDIEGLSIDLDIKGIRLCTRTPLFGGLAIRELGQLVLIDSEGKDEDATYDGLGTRFNLIYVSKEELGL